MSKPNLVALSFLVFCLGILALASTLSSQNPNKVQKPVVGFERFPVVDYSRLEPTDASEREKRTKKGKKFNNRYIPRINELSESTFLANDWSVGLSALPVERSTAVIVGRIMNAEADFSEDKTSIYSEFTILIDTIFKNDENKPLISDRSVMVYRLGGRVRLPSGRIIVSSVDNQDMPLVGGRYVLFLIHDSDNGGSAELFHILTGYELRDGKVLPLDRLSPAHPINKYRGVSETLLLTDLSSALATLRP